MANMANMDNIMAMTLLHVNIAAEINSYPLTYKRDTKIYDDWEHIRILGRIGLIG